MSYVPHAPLTISQFVTSPLALGFHPDFGSTSISPTKIAILKEIYGEPLDNEHTFDVECRVSEGVRNTLSFTTGRFTEATYIKFLRDQGRMRGLITDRGASLVSIVAGRRSGKTLLGELMCAYETYCSLMEPPSSSEQQIVAVATTNDQALVLKSGFDDLVASCSFMGHHTDKSTRQNTYFKRDEYSFRFRSCPVTSVPNRLVGATIGFSVFDEGAHMAWEDFEYARSIVDTAGSGCKRRMIALTTPVPLSAGARTNGRAYRAWHEDDASLSMEIPTWELNPDIPIDFLRDQYNRMGADKFDEEYGASWSFEREPETPQLTCSECGQAIGHTT